MLGLCVHKVLQPLPVKSRALGSEGNWLLNKEDPSAISSARKWNIHAICEPFTGFVWNVGCVILCDIGENIYKGNVDHGKPFCTRCWVRRGLVVNFLFPY